MNHENWKFWKESSAAYFQSNGLCEMWFDRDPSTAPQRQKSSEQFVGERRDSLPEMPQGGTHEGRNMGRWKSGTGDVQSLQFRVSSDKDKAGINMQQRMPIGMGSDQREQTMEFVPRVATGIIARVDRLKAIGNGQVPQCAAEAWRLLGGPVNG